MLGSNAVTEAQLRTLPLTDAGVDYVLNASRADPAKSVEDCRDGNLIGQMPLPENKVSLQHQSHSGECLFLTYLRLRKDIWGIYDQTTTISFEITNSREHRTRTTYTPDFLVVDAKGVTAYEIKADYKLIRHCESRPKDWIRDESGYRYLPAERYFNALGIKHQTIANSELNLTRAKNIDLICSHREAKQTEKLARQKKKALQIVQFERGIKAGELLNRLGTRDATAFLHLLDEGEIYASMDEALLTDVDHVWLAITQQEADERTVNDRYLADILRERRVIGNNEIPDGAYIDVVAFRLALVQGHNPINPRTHRHYSDRSIRRTRKTYCEAGGDVLSLAPAWSRCGNREDRLSITHRAFLDGCIREARSSPDEPTYVKAYQDYKELFLQHKKDNDEIDERPVDPSTYYRRWQRLSGHTEDAQGRGGRRLANAVRPVYDSKHRISVAIRAFEVAHIDHWLADFFVLVCTLDGKRYAARPWITAMIDGATTEILAIWMSLDSPSRKADCMVIRECVLRHGRLPETIITDSGSDFKSVYFSVMLASLNVAHLQRPPESPGFGHEIESLFATMKVQFARGLPGYGLSIEESRAVAGSFKSENRATLDLVEAWDLLKRYAYNGYNESVRSKGRPKTRIDLRRECLEMFPMSGRLVKIDLRFMVITAIDASQGEYKLSPRRGIHVNNVWFTHPRLTEFSGYKKYVVVRLEPYDPSIAYVAINHQWFVCYSAEARVNALRSDASLLKVARDQFEVGAIRKKIENEHSHRVAKMVNDELNKILDARRIEAEKPERPEVDNDNSKKSCECNTRKRKRWADVSFEQLPTF